MVVELCFAWRMWFSHSTWQSLEKRNCYCSSSSLLCWKFSRREELPIKTTDSSHYPDWNDSKGPTKNGQKSRVRSVSKSSTSWRFLIQQEFVSKYEFVNRSCCRLIIFPLSLLIMIPSFAGNSRPRVSCRGWPWGRCRRCRTSKLVTWLGVEEVSGGHFVFGKSGRF